MIDYNQLAAEYASHRQVHPAVVTELLSGSGITRASRVLEVGCGPGNYIARVKELTDCSCWGVDPSEQMLAQARSSAIAFQIARAEALNQPDAFFDLVFSVDVIHHVTERDRYFGQAMRVLKPCGKLCTVTDSEWIIRHRQPLSVYFPETIEPELRRYPGIEPLRAEMRAAGFEAITERAVEFAYLLTDCSAYRARTYSALHLISQAAFERGIAQMERDLQNGPIQCVSRYVLIWGAKPG